MKKIFLLLSILCAMQNVYAQGSRWYDHAWAIDLYNGGSMSHKLVPLWFDSTVLQTNYQGDTIPIQYLSAAQMTDPIYFTLFNDPNVYPPNTLHIHSWDAYYVDSISFSGVYVKNTNRPNTIVDTLIISVSPQNYQSMKDVNTTGDPNDDWVDNYVVPPGDSIYGHTIFEIDSVNMRLVTTGTLADVDTFVVAVPGGCTIPAGNGFATTVTFKSGDVVDSPYVDMFTDYHHFYFLSGEALGQGQVMPYYYYILADRNSSNLMRSGDTTAYYPSVFLEGWSTIAYHPEFHSIGGYVNCPNCPLSVQNVSKAFGNITAYPNPAGDEVNISFAPTSDAQVVITITDLLGQVMAKKDMRNVQANSKANVVFSTKDIAGGIYFYTVEANGQKTTGRFVVTH